MSEKQEQLGQFKSILSNYFDRIKRNLPKQYITFKDFLNKMIDLLKTESQPKLGKHLVVFRLTINMKSTKLKELALQTLLVFNQINQNLVSSGFIYGQQEDTSNEFYTEEFADLFVEPQNKEKKIIDSLVISVSQCLLEKDEMAIQAIKLLVAFVTNPWCEVQSQTLNKIIRTIIYVYTQAKSNAMERMAKTALLQIVDLTFQAVDEEVYKIIKNKRKLSIKDDVTQRQVNLLLIQMVDEVQLNSATNNKQQQQFNEQHQPSGEFGWCIICRKKAMFFCKDTKVPICSFQCKKQHTEFIELTQRTYNGALRQQEQSLECSLQLFDSLSKLLSNKTTLQMPKNQQIVLELLLFILNTNDMPLKKNSQFIKITKDTLCSQLLKYCLETEKTLYMLSFKIFQRLALTMRNGLKHEISIFINQIYLTILLSANSTFQHKQTALDSLHHILARPKTLLEFYINYDCNMKHECLVEKIFDTLHQIIIYNLYQKVEYQFQQNQDLSLKILAAQLLSELIENLNNTFDKYIFKPSMNEIPIQQENDDETIQYINPIELQRQMKQEIMKGCSVFNKKPEKGIQYLINANIIQNDELEIAKFLRETPNLTKEAVGEYLGGHETINIKVLSEYTDMLGFKDMSIEQALRYYLDQFTLPKESQQVDRVVQKFSDRYYKENENSFFKSSNAIYTFTYLLVMLQTDLHNPNVDEKMKLTDFVKLARSINDGDDVPLDVLQQHYQSILKTPLALHEKEKTRKFLQESLTQSLRKKQDLFQKEKEALLKQGKELIKNQQDSIYIKINQDSAYLIKPLLETIGSQLLEIFIVMFEQNDNQALLYIKSILTFIKLCSYFSIPLADHMNTIIKATKLNQLSALTKNHIIFIQQILITIPLIGNGLREQGWKSVFEMISRLDELRIIKNDTEIQIITILPDFQSEFDLIDKLFIQSKNLDNDAIQELIAALCIMSKEEIYIPQPRLFSLQKLVEVSDYNMDRVKLIWTKMWNIVRDHINEVAIKEKRVAMFAVDSLKQLNIKFLQKEELYNFQFQREVLRPFETIFISTDLDVKEFILSCIHHLVLNHKNNIKSGWRVIFDLINLGLKEENDRISRIAFQIISRIMSHNLELIQDVFVDLIQCLTVLGRKDQEDMSLAAVEFVRQCLNYLSAQAQILPKKNWDDQIEQDTNAKFTVQQLETHWVPLLGLLSGLAGDRRASVQFNSMETLFQLLQQYGYAFSIEFWKIVFQSVLRPIFDEIQFTFQYATNQKQGEQNPSDKENHWFKNSCKQGFSQITNLMSRYFPKLRTLLPDFLKLFENCIQNQNEKLAKFSIQAVKNMVIQIGEQFTSQEWDEIINFIHKMLKISTPNKLLMPIDPQFPPKLQKQQSNKQIMRSLTEESYSQCASQLLLIQITIQIIEKFNQELTIQQLDILEKSCHNSYQFAKTFNSQIEQRYDMWKSGFMADMKQLPGLLKQEREAYACMLTIKYTLLTKLKSDPTYQIVLQQYINILLESIKHFNQKHELFLKKDQDDSHSNNSSNNNNNNVDNISKLKAQEIERESQNSRTLLDTYILPKVLQLSDEQLNTENKELFEQLLIASQYSSEQSFTQMMCTDCKNCKRCAAYAKTNLDQSIRMILKRLYNMKQ